MLNWIDEHLRTAPYCKIPIAQYLSRCTAKSKDIGDMVAKLFVALLSDPDWCVFEITILHVIKWVQRLPDNDELVLPQLIRDCAVKHISGQTTFSVFNDANESDVLKAGLCYYLKEEKEDIGPTDNTGSILRQIEKLQVSLAPYRNDTTLTRTLDKTFAVLTELQAHLKHKH